MKKQQCHEKLTMIHSIRPNFRNTLKSSEVLFTKLSTEYANWKHQLQDINKSISQIDLDAFLIAFSITHLSHLTFEKRR